jgi:hypothetical protein
MVMIRKVLGVILKARFVSRLVFFFACCMTLSLSLSAAPSQSPQPATSSTFTIYAYDYWYPLYLEDYFKKVDAVTIVNRQKDGKPQCAPVFKNAIKNGIFDIRYALGYFDDSQGIEMVHDGINHGISPSLDISIFHIVREFLQKPCVDRRRLCEFKSSGDPSSGKVILQKPVRLMGSEVMVQITLTHASASESYVANKTSLFDRQRFLTLQSEENYFGGLGTADVVFYNGHSRSGGGPDFNPPRLDNDLHVNYEGYYKVQQPGIRRLLERLRLGENKDSVVGLFSCFSHSHFYERLLKTNPKQRLVLSSDKVNYLDTLYASMGYLEGLLHGQCGQDLADTAKQTESVKDGFKGFQIR